MRFIDATGPNSQVTGAGDPQGERVRRHVDAPGTKSLEESKGLGPWLEA